MSNDTTNSMKLAQFLAKAGIASRRASEKLIQGGDVAVNDEPCTVTATRVTPGVDTVSFKGRQLSIESHVYYLLHKPRGYTCTSADPHAEKLAIDLLDLGETSRVFNVGRLDKESEGLILFTNDGEFSNLISHPRHGILKTYEVHATGEVTADKLHKLLKGVTDEGDLLRALKADIVSSDRRGGILRVVIGEGKKREVRRMCKAIDLRVKRLLRTTIGNLDMGTFKPGFHRALTPQEVQAFRDAAVK